jgi:hypothetical protein
MRLFDSLRHRPFALLWSGQTVSRLGDSLYRIALSWWVLEKTGSATAMGTVALFSFAPMVPPERLGRVSSIDALGSFVLMPVGFALAGRLTDALGPAQVFLLGGGATVGLALLTLLHPAIRRLD